MASQAGLAGDARSIADHIKQAADFVVAHGPSFGSERWEEQGGYSPSTIAAEIAGLVAAGRIADVQRRRRRARGSTGPPPTTSSARIKGWTVTTTGPLRRRPLLHPAVQERRPERGDHLQPRQRRPGRRPARGHRRRLPGADPARRSCRPTTPTCAARCRVVDQRSSARRPTAAPGFYRYGTADAGHRGRVRRLLRAGRRPTARPAASRGRPANNGSGPPLAGAVRRARRAAPADRRPAPARRTAARHAWPLRLRHRAGPRAGLGEPGPGRVAVRHRPETASIGFANGRPAGSRLAADLGAGPAGAARPQSLGAGRPVEQPRDRPRPVRRPAPPATRRSTVTAPADGADVTTATVDGHRHHRAGGDGGRRVDRHRHRRRDHAWSTVHGRRERRVLGDRARRRSAPR